MKWKHAEKHFLYAELSKMLGAGLGVDRTIEALLKHKLSPAQRALLQGMKNGLGEGKSIAGAFASAPVETTELECSLVDAGEKGGQLEQSLQHLSHYFQLLDETRRRVRAQLVYPVILFHAAILLPAIPRAIFAQGQATIWGLVVIPLLIGYGLVFAAAVLVRKAIARAADDAATDRLLRAAPFAGKAREAFALGRFCRVFHMHLLAAMPIAESVRAAGKASQSGIIQEAAMRLDGVTAAGGRLGPAVLEEAAFPPDFATSLNTADEAGTLDVELARWAQLYQDEAIAATEAAGKWYPKVIYIMVLVLAAYQLLSIGFGYIGFLQNLMEGM